MPSGCSKEGVDRDTWYTFSITCKGPQVAFVVWQAGNTGAPPVFSGETDRRVDVTRRVALVCQEGTARASFRQFWRSPP